MDKIVEKTEIKILIHQIRGKSVMLDSDLAILYKVTTKRLNEAVKRNSNRFPADFMFQLTLHESENLRSQFATSRYGGRRYKPFVFTEQGVAMLSSVLKSEVAIEVNIQIMRAFVQMRRHCLTSIELKRKIDGMEKKYDTQFKIVFDALRQLIEPITPKSKKSPMGFTGEK